MCQSIHRLCMFDTCLLCFPVEFGAKMLGYIGVILNSINIVLNIVVLIVLTVGAAPSLESDVTSTISDVVNITEFRFVYFICNFPESAITNISFEDAIILVVFSLLISIFILFSSIVLIIGISKKRLSYVKFSLLAGLVRITLMFVTAVAHLPEDMAFFTLFYISMPIYFLLVIRTAYYNMLQNEEMQSINRPFKKSKGSYYA